MPRSLMLACLCIAGLAISHGGACLCSSHSSALLSQFACCRLQWHLIPYDVVQAGALLAEQASSVHHDVTR